MITQHCLNAINKVVKIIAEMNKQEHTNITMEMYETLDPDKKKQIHKLCALITGVGIGIYALAGTAAYYTAKKSGYIGGKRKRHQRKTHRRKKQLRSSKRGGMIYGVSDGNDNAIELRQGLNAMLDECQPLDVMKRKIFNFGGMQQNKQHTYTQFRECLEKLLDETNIDYQVVDALTQLNDILNEVKYWDGIYNEYRPEYMIFRNIKKALQLLETYNDSLGIFK